jgi:hypothetical protein
MCHLPRHHARSAGAALLSLLLLSCIAAEAQNPPLAEVARQEAERRKATKASPRILTNQDLPKITGRPSAPAAAATPDAPLAADKADAVAPAPEAEKLEKNETWWRLRIAEPRDALRRNEILLDALQARVNGLTSEFVARDDPYQRARIGDDRQKAILELERVHAEVDAAKKAIDEIEEEARRAGVPPGWLR